MTAINTITLEAIADLTLGDFKAAHTVGNNVAAAYYLEFASQGTSIGNANIVDYAVNQRAVARNDGINAAYVNAYGREVAGDSSVNLEGGSDDWLEVQFELMQNHLDARLDAIGASGTGELNYEATLNIHGTALDAVGLGPEANPLYTPRSQLGETDPARAQQLFLDTIASNGLADLIGDGFRLAFVAELDGRQPLADILRDYGDQAEWMMYAARAADDIVDTYPGDPHPVDEWLNNFEAISAIAAAGFDGVAGWVEGLKDLANEYLPTLNIPFGILPDFALAALEPWIDAPTIASPLTIDIDGDGVELTTFNATSTATFFDIDGDGFAEQTAWVGADDGLLVRDLDEFGTIDSVEELFGSPNVDGFALLSAFGDNGDHVINQYDNVWSDLLVWKDADGDAVTDSGELHSLASLNIVSFDLAGVTASSSTISGNPISHTSTYTLSGGTTRTVADAWFVHSNVNTAYVGDCTIDVRTLFLPTLRGFGELPDLHIAMSQDEDLLELVQDFVTAWDISRLEDGAFINADVEEILWTWAGVDAVSPSSRGGLIDARRLEFLAEFFGESFLQIGSGATPNQNVASILEEAWERLFYAMKAQLLIQAGAGALFDGAVSYNAWSGELEGTFALSQNFIDDLEIAAPATEPELRAYWEQITELILFTKEVGNLDPADILMLENAIDGSGGTYTWEQLTISSAFPWYGLVIGGSPDDDTIYGTNGADTLNGGAGADLIYGLQGADTISGGIGSDTVYGAENDDTIYGNEGVDELYGDSGADTLYGDDGDDLVSGGAGNDTLYGGNGDDELRGEGDNDVLYGGAGNDTVIGDAGNDIYHYTSGECAVDRSNATVVNSIQTSAIGETIREEDQTIVLRRSREAVIHREPL